MRSRGHFLNLVAAFWMLGTVIAASFAWSIIGTNVSGNGVGGSGMRLTLPFALHRNATKVGWLTLRARSCASCGPPQAAVTWIWPGVRSLEEGEASHLSLELICPVPVLRLPPFQDEPPPGACLRPRRRSPPCCPSFRSSLRRKAPSTFFTLAALPTAASFCGGLQM